MTRKWLIAALMLAALTGCDACGEDAVSGETQPDDGIRVETPRLDTGEMCGGCVTADEECLEGDEQAACGAGGAACVACEDGDTCLPDGSCGQAPMCGLATCDGCCDSAGTCVGGSATDACGSGGAACMTCELGASCEAGVCEAPPELCGPENCNGCCDGTGACVGGDGDAACGGGGGLCTDCTASGRVCGGGMCEDPPPGCADTCDGCCAGETCVSEPDDAQCGSAGAMCMACGADEVCRDGACIAVIYPMADEWDLTLISAEIPTSKPGVLMSGWDPDGGAPDPFMRMYAEIPAGYWFYETDFFANEFQPVWNELMFVGLTNEALAGGVEFELVDYDPFDPDDLICYQFEIIDPTTVSNLDIVTTCADDPRVTWTWRLDPSP